MALLDIKGVRVTFPFEPYPCQVTYMEKVLDCLQKNQNGVLESPTGTGKTLCLLCSTLAWLEGRKAQVDLNRQAGVAAMLAEAGKENLQDSALQTMAASLQKSSGASWGSEEFVVPKIIYASRTHSQLSQAVQELKRTAYSSMKTSVIGSRDQLCINEQVKKEQNNAAKVHMCRAKVAARQCHYYNVLDDLKRNTEARQIVGSVADIEDLVSHGSKSKICPYYLARELKSDADIIFMPYNYLLDPKSRRAHGVELQGNIVIFDEAHNLERICEESASFDLSSVDLATAIEETTQLGVKFTEMASAESDAGDTGDPAALPEFTLEDIIRLKKTLLDLEELLDSEPLTEKGATKPGMFMFELLSKVNIGFESKSLLIDLLDKLVTYLNNDGTSSALHSKGAGLSKFADAIKIVFSQEPGEFASVSKHKETLAQNYKVHIHLKQGTSNRKKKLDSWASTGAGEKPERILSYWCFSPGYSMKDLMAHGVKSIILTSGTLSPISSFTMEMQVPFPVRLENPHVIQKHQVWVGTLGCGPDGATLNSNYQNRFTETYQASLGNSIVNFARVVPNGLLVFFPSYPVMEKCVEYWQSSNVWQRILAYKPVIVEPRGKDAFVQAIDDFYEKINDPKLNGAVFMAVCRGKVSEGLDFADNNGRAVVITGLPFPPMLDPRVVLKMQHLDSLQAKAKGQSLTGQQWYRQQATRAVNQAIGRVIRHKDDFGAIMLCDTRFSSPESVNQLPVWVRPYAKKYTNFGLAVRDMLGFFKVAEKTLPVPQTKQAKGRGGQSGSGCVGAYFEPTASRWTGGMEQASNVACHVPGLSRHSHPDDCSISSLKAQYSQPSGSGGNLTGNSSGCRRGLLGALDSSERLGTHFDKSPTTQRPGTESSTANHPKPTDAGSSGNKISSQAAPHLNLAESYIAEVKAVLTGGDYKRFSSALHQYKKSQSLVDVTPVLADIFTTRQEHMHLFRKFYRFVRSQHKAEFDQLCVSLTGESCGYKPEDKLSSKRVAHSSSSVTDGKRARLDSKTTVGGSSSLGQWSSSKITTQTTMPSVTPAPHTSQTASTSGSQDSGSSGKHLAYPRVETDETGGAVVDKKTSTNSQASAVDSTGSLSQASSESVTSNSVTGSSQGDMKSAASKFDVEKIRKLAGNVNKILPKSGYPCEKCKNDAHIPYENQCGHVCCFVCWKEVLQGNKQCPGGCGQQARRRHLRRLLFPSGDDKDVQLPLKQDKSEQPSTSVMKP
ncbi:hypothetical protein BaRGS_00020256 [Batillaria attramentaria]|uniref:Regulator of telomere elongation helicase 1 homolog n=1 Tax=Batillaria attramentaria TaxID=370345 RepID=A0ABD0KMJ4_9CAEN